MLLTYFSAAYRIYIKFLALQAALKFIVKHVHMSVCLYVWVLRSALWKYLSKYFDRPTKWQHSWAYTNNFMHTYAQTYKHTNIPIYIHTYINEYLNKYLLMLMGMNANKCATHIAHIVVIAVHFLSRQFFKIKIIRIFQ